MKRPGPVGIVVLLAFAIVAAIEFRTLLGMFGIDVATGTYYPAAAVVIALIVAALVVLPEKDTSQASNI